jgi:hypothetical protein
MKLCALIAAGVVALAPAVPVAAHEALYRATLTGTAEIPSNASPGTGIALITLDFDTLMMDVQVSFAGLLGTTTASHIHCCTATPGANNVGVATVLPSFTGFPSGVSSGTYDHVFDMSLASSYNPAFVTAQGSVANAFSALVAGMETSNAYLNVHSSLFGGGEIRGLLAPIPEPETYALMLAGLAAIALAARRRGTRA